MPNEVKQKEGPDFSSMMGEAGGQVLDQLDKHPWMTAIGLIILGSGIFFGSLLAQHYGAGGLMGNFQVGFISTASVLGVSYLAFKILGLVDKRIAEHPTYQWIDAKATKVALVSGLIFVSFTLGAQMGPSVMGLPVSVVGGAAVGVGLVGLYAQYRIERARREEKEKPWERKLIGIASVAASILGPLGLALLVAYMMRGGTTSPEFLYGLMAIPIVITYGAFGALSIFKPDSQRLRGVEEKQVPITTEEYQKFYAGKKLDRTDLTIDEILERKGEYPWLDNNKEYFNWLFPKVSADALAKIMNKDKLISAYEMMIDFYGFETERGVVGSIVRTEKYEERKAVWISEQKHHRRIARILKTLMDAELFDEAQAFYQALEKEKAIPESARDLWNTATK